MQVSKVQATEDHVMPQELQLRVALAADRVDLGLIAEPCRARLEEAPEARHALSQRYTESHLVVVVSAAARGGSAVTPA
jgi:hypothetical protein